MDNFNFKKHIISENESLIEAMTIINANAVGLVYITDAYLHLVGCLTDGDVRRFIINSGRVDVTIREAMNRKPHYIYETEIKNAIKKMKR